MAITPRLPPDYSMHDPIYQRLRQQGASGWDDDASDIYTEMHQLVTPLLPARANGLAPKVLELGCGAGNLSLRLAQSGYQVAGVDIAPTAIDWARERAQAAGLVPDFRVDDVLRLATCADAAFDAVVDGHCLHCIIGDDRARCLAAVRRVLKPGGVLVVLSMCGEVGNEKMLQGFDPLTQVTVHAQRPTRYIGRAQDIVAELATAGFVIHTSQVLARKDADDLDTLLVHASTPKAA